MRVRARVDHINDYRTDGGPGAAVGEMRLKAKGVEYDIPNDSEAKLLIADRTVEAVKAKD